MSTFLWSARAGGALVAAGMCFMLTSSVAFADTQAPRAAQPPVQIPPEVIADFARMFKVSPDDPELQAVFRKTNEALAAPEQPLPKSYSKSAPSSRSSMNRDREALSFRLARLSVARHYRFEGGVAFEAAPPTVLEEHERASTRGAVSYFQNQMRASIQALKSTPPLPVCERDDLDQERKAEESVNGTSDILFLRGAPPDDAKALFGSTVTVVSCSNKPGDQCALSAGRLNLRCLPTRIRSSEGKRVRLEGKKALMNFDLSKNGKFVPEVRDSIATYLGESAVEAKQR